MSEAGFIYLWFDRHRKMFYLGSHWGSEYDSYICSSPRMLRAYKRRPQDFRRRILSRGITSRQVLLLKEGEWLALIKPEESGTKYYNLFLKSWEAWHANPDRVAEIGPKISVSNTGKHSREPRSQEVKDKISAKKRENFERRRAETGQSYSDETIQSWVGIKRGPQSEESNQKRSESLKLAYAEGRKKAGYTPTEEQKRAKSAAMKGRPGNPQSEATRTKLSKKWIVTSPSGEIFHVVNLKRFCEENGLANTNIYKPSGSKGWHAVKAPTS